MQNRISHFVQSNRQVLLDSLFLSLLSLSILAGVGMVPLHGDEPTQLYMARDYYTWFVADDAAQLTYRHWDELDGEAATRQDLRLKDGIVARLLYGFVAYHSGYAADDLNQQWAWGSGWDWNHANGHVPTDDLLLRARVASAVMLACSVVALFGIGMQLGGRITGYVAALVYSMNPAVLINGRRAMMESSMLLFSLLAVLVALHLLHQRRWWQFGLLGLFSGLAVASKHTSAVTIAALFAGCGAYWLYFAIRSQKQKAPYRRGIAGLFVAGFLSLAVFYALNPAWWGAPITRAQEVLTIRADFIRGQLGFFGGYESALEQVQGFITHALYAPLVFAETDIDGFLANQTQQIAAYQHSWLRGFSPGLLYFVLIPAGIVALVRLPAIAPTTRWLFSAYAIAMLLLTLLTPLAWQRYYIPIYPVLALLAGLSMAGFWHFKQHSSATINE